MPSDEIIETFDIFNLYQITEENQRLVFENGIYFDFTKGSLDPTKRNKRLTAFGFSKLLKMCHQMHIPIDANNIIEEPFKYEYLLGILCNLEELDNISLPKTI